MNQATDFVCCKIKWIDEMSNGALFNSVRRAGAVQRLQSSLQWPFFKSSEWPFTAPPSSPNPTLSLHFLIFCSCPIEKALTLQKSKVQSFSLLVIHFSELNVIQANHQSSSINHSSFMMQGFIIHMCQWEITTEHVPKCNITPVFRINFVLFLPVFLICKLLC